MSTPSPSALARRGLLGLALLPLAARAASAHHGWSGYDDQNVLTLAGPVQEVAFANPHCHVRVEALGKVWDCVLAPLSRMTSRGLPTGSIAVGDMVTVVGYPSRRILDEMRAEQITVAGKTVELR